MTPRFEARHLMAASAVTTGGLGLALVFLPMELAPVLGLGGGDAWLPAQLFGGALAAFGILNWAGRGAVYGGIYGRPILLGNLLLGVMVATSLGREAAGPGAWAVVALFTLHALGFARFLFGRVRLPGDGDA